VRLSFFVLCVVILGAACSGDNPSVPGETDIDTELADTDLVTGITIEGHAVEFFTQAALPAGVCVSLLDPISMMTGGGGAALGVGETDDVGAFSIAGVSERPQLGLLIRTASCTAGDPLFPSVSGVAAASYLSLDDGQILTGQTAFAISSSAASDIDASATIAAYVGTPSVEGMIVGLILDASGVPIAGASVVCEACTVLYVDEDFSDGMFTTGMDANTVTSVNGLFVLPSAAVGSYGANDGGGHTWQSFFAGSNPGEASIIALTAD
jgi:hypothetical protein